MLRHEMLEAGEKRLREVLDASDITAEERRTLIAGHSQRVADAISEFFSENRGLSVDPRFGDFLDELVGEDALREELAELRLTFARTGMLPDPPERYQSHSQPLDNRKGGVIMCGGSIGAHAMA